MSRRNVLKAAAWSAPVIAVAVAAPHAAASPTPGALTATFAVVVAELRWDDVFAGYLYITNMTGADIVDEQATLELTGFPTGETPPVTVDYPAGDVLLDEDDDQAPRTVQNSALPLQSASNGGLLLYSGSFSLADGESLLIGFYIRRPAFNAVQKFFFIAGILKIGDVDYEITGDGRLRVDLPDE